MSDQRRKLYRSLSTDGTEYFDRCTTTLRITKADLNDQNEYVPSLMADVVVEGSIAIDPGLGWVRFRRALRASLSIVTGAGTGIKAGWGIKAGDGIEAGWGIEAGEGIKAGWDIEAGEGIKAGWGIEAGGGIEAGEGIEAGCGIEAGEGMGIFAGVHVRLNLWAKCAVVSATRKPENLVSGHWQAPVAVLRRGDRIRPTPAKTPPTTQGRRGR